MLISLQSLLLFVWTLKADAALPIFLSVYWSIDSYDYSFLLQRLPRAIFPIGYPDKTVKQGQKHLLSCVPLCSSRDQIPLWQLQHNPSRIIWYLCSFSRIAYRKGKYIRLEQAGRRKAMWTNRLYYNTWLSSTIINVAQPEASCRRFPIIPAHI